MPRAAVGLVLAVFFAQPARAGVYAPDERCPFPVKAVANGSGTEYVADELSFGPANDGEFPLRLGTLLNNLDERSEADRGSKNPDRAALLDRIQELQSKRTRTPGETHRLAVDRMRAGNPTAALDLLAPRPGPRGTDFRVLANRAHAHALRGEWAEARRAHEAAVLDAEMPPDVLKAVTPEQRGWLLKVERRYYARWLRERERRADDRTPPATEPVFPLFEGVKFANERGEYEPGNLAPAERAKLPPDAVAIVQQLLLWYPSDTALYWLLAELYAADGRVRQADAIFFQCVQSRQYSNRTTLMNHRAAVRRAVEALPAPEPPPPPPPPPEGLAALGLTPERLAAVGAAFGAAVLVLLALQVRALRRRAVSSRTA